MHKRIVIANPHGFCAGVRRAIESVEAALKLNSGPVYCLNEIVHNQGVVQRLTARGVRFVRRLDEVPRGKCVVLSAHGVSPAVREEAQRRGLRVLDATCPFVSKLHGEVRDFAARGYTVLLIGYRAHDEIIGIAGEAPDHVIVVETLADAQRVQVPTPGKVAVITQTTLSVDQTAQVMKILQTRFPELKRPPTEGICRATINRQQAVKLLTRTVGRVLVLGSRNSSNTRRLTEVATDNGAQSFLIDTVDALTAVPLETTDALGIAAGASTPEWFMDEIIQALRTQGFGTPEYITATKEDLHFHLPRELREANRAG